MKISLDVHYDSDNSDCIPDAEFTRFDDNIVITLHDPEREVQVSCRDIVRALRLLCEEF